MGAQCTFEAFILPRKKGFKKVIFKRGHLYHINIIVRFVNQRLKQNPYILLIQINGYNKSRIMRQ